ncbi:MAG: InlB B-repeat-containing protein [Bifidobacteriaceae bacterium]|nr:InlB B-repeat-containing protein [Bifidobacteriaceae bacterium]MCI1978637.1 InlB B-repeat-containing protein [Bifidobacteriaceae bacterium]
MDTAWTAWTEGDKTIPFSMNGAASTATVSLPKGMQLQFGVVVTVTEDPAPNRYTYLFRDGTGVTSGTGYSIDTTDVTSLPKAYIPRREDTPQHSSSYYSSSNAVRAKGTIADATNAGITLEYEQTLYFSSSGIIQTTTFKNAGTKVLSNFSLLNKVDTMLSGNDKIPVYYGAKKFQYYLRDPSNEIQRDLYVEATDGSGVASSRAARYQVSNPRGMAITGLDDTWNHAEGDLAFNAGDSEIIFVNAPRTLGAGQSQSTQFRVFFKEHGAVNIRYLNKATKSPMKVPDSFKTAIVGEAGDPYSMTQPSIDGYRSAGIAEDSAPESGTLTADLPSPVIKYLYVAGESAVKYDGNGSESGSTDDTVGTTNQSVKIADNGFVRSGYSFTGWNTKADGSGTAYAVGDPFVLTPSELKLFAQWKADPSAVTYDGNGAESGSVNDTVGVTDESVSVADNGFTRDGYTFTGWNTAADDSGTAYEAGDDVTLPAAGLKLFAQWKADEADITYDGNGSESGLTEDTAGVTDQTVAVADNGFTRDGYTFTGWNTAADGSGTAYAAGDEVVLTPSELKLFAQWKADEADITYDGNGSESGSVDDTVGVTDGSVSVAENGFVRDGYTFTGWNTAADGSGTAYAAGDEVVLTPSELKLYAQWEVEKTPVTPENPAATVTPGASASDSTPGSDTTSGSPSSKVTPGATASKLAPSSSSAGVEKKTNSLLARTGADVGVFAVIALLAVFVGAVALMVSKERRASVAGSHVSRRF